MFDLTSWVHVLKNDEGYCNVINDCIKNNQILTIDNKVVRREFEEFFSKFTPQQLNAYCYGVSGSEAIEHALIIAEHITKKSKFLHFGGCYHGSSICLLNITYSETKRVSDYVFDILHPPYETKDIGEFPDMDDFFEKLPVENEYAGVIIDPSFGNMVFNAGIHFFLKLRKYCYEKKVMLIFDEVRTGIGRTGKMFAFEQYDIVPDILCISKALSNGFPLSVTIYDGNSLYETEKRNLHNRIETTFAGQDLALKSAMYTVEKISEDMTQIAKKAIYIIKRLEELKKYKCICEVRNFGMIFGMEFSDNWSAIKFFTLVNKKNIRVNYPNKTVVVLSPSLCIEVQEIDEIMDSFHDVCSFI